MEVDRSLPRFLILGTGIGGLMTALKLSQMGSVTLVAKNLAYDNATRYAQGGIASVWSRQDRFEDHQTDTEEAGAGLCVPEIVKLCVERGPELVQELIDLGVPFTRQQDQSFDLHREGGHGRRRILHAHDATGLAIEETLLSKVRAEPRIRLLEDHVAIDLITEGKLLKRWRKPGRCLGAYVLDKNGGGVQTLAADFTILATGGCGKVYLYTSNPDVSTGDGVAMAFRAGAKIVNMEFMQFHPTCLYHPAAKTFLISEALRGEGAELKTIDGRSIMEGVHPLGSLAPRDIVARAIDVEMKKSGDKHVFLDTRHFSEDDFRKKFPRIYDVCKTYGISPSEESIPVVPAAHYICGGVLVDQNAQTSIEGLYAVGEVSYTGLHGANRLASNSLLEAVVFAQQAASHLKLQVKKGWKEAKLPSARLPDWDSGQAVELEERIDIASLWLEVRSLMWNYVGIVRSNARLEKAKRRLDLIQKEVNQFYWDHLLTQDLIELRNLVAVSQLIVECASRRAESRGLHYNVNYPNRDDRLQRRNTVV